jgi:hypothetical protein
LQLPQAEVVLVASLAQTGVGYTQRLHNKSPLKNSVLVHAVLGGSWPKWQPFNGFDRHALKARRQSESVLAGGYGNGGIRLPPDNDYGARPSAGEQLAPATAERTSFAGDGF